MTVKDIIAAKLKELGADGLCCDNCGCGTGDLFCCESYPGECVPARAVIATEAHDDYDAGDTIYEELKVKGD